VKAGAKFFGAESGEANLRCDNFMEMLGEI